MVLIAFLSIFHKPVSHLYNSLEKKCLFRSFAHLLIKLSVLCYWVVCIPYIFWILTPYQIYGLQILCPFCRLPFHFVIAPLMFKSFDIVQLAYFSFFAYNFSVISKILLSSSMSRSFFPMFSSSSLITVSHTTFKSLIFQVNFEYGIRQGSSFILYHEDIQCSPYHLLKRLSFPYCVLGTLVKN